MCTPVYRSLFSRRTRREHGRNGCADVQTSVPSIWIPLFLSCICFREKKGKTVCHIVIKTRLTWDKIVCRRTSGVARSFVARANSPPPPSTQKEEKHFPTPKVLHGADCTPFATPLDRITVIAQSLLWKASASSLLFQEITNNKSTSRGEPFTAVHELHSTDYEHAVCHRLKCVCIYG